MDTYYEVCSNCGITANILTCLNKYGEPPLKLSFDVSAFHNGTCDICGQRKPVTEPRDFFYPDFSLLVKILDGKKVMIGKRKNAK